MRNFCIKLIAALGVMYALAATPAMAQATRTWVSGVGDDVNPCSRTAPCKTFAGAISKTAAGGEINVLDPGGFGGVTITKSITIRSDGAEAGVLVAGSNGIVVNAGANDVVVLDGLDFEGVNAGLNGVDFRNGKALIVVNCIFRNFLNNGINFIPPGNAGLNVVDTTFSKAGQSGTFAGINIRPSGTANVNATIIRTQIFDGTFGIIADGAAGTGKINVVVRDSNISRSAQNGITSSNGTAANVTLLLDNVSVFGNGNKGLSAGGANAGMLVANSTIFGNTGGGLFTSGGGVLASYGNNRVNGNNGQDGVFSSVIATK